MEQAARKKSFPTNITPEENRTTEAVLARTLKLFREMSGLTQEQVAKAIGASPISISHWENGLKVPRSEWLTALAKLYGVEVCHLFGQESEEPKKRGKRK